jgi:hypothetical protein
MGIYSGVRMQIAYQQIQIRLHFAEPLVFDIPPLFAVRSVLGWQLHTMCCIAQGNKCPDCLYNRTCAYVFLFETILDRNNTVQNGRDRASHPFVLSLPVPPTEAAESDTLDFCLTLAGRAVEYLPYIYAALVRAGTCGLFKSRTPFTVCDMQTGGQHIIIEENRLRTDILPDQWKTDIQKSAPVQTGRITVRLVSPLRFKTEGKYSSDFTADSFFRCLERRMFTMCGLYGTVDEAEQQGPADNRDRFSGMTITGRDLTWKDSVHYSSRQKRAMELGGAVGAFTLTGTYTPYMSALLDFARIFGAGKNTNFGLGQMEYSLCPDSPEN